MAYMEDHYKVTGICVKHGLQALSLWWETPLKVVENNQAMIQIQTGKMAMAKKNIVVLDQKEKKSCGDGCSNLNNFNIGEKEHEKLEKIVEGVVNIGL